MTTPNTQAPADECEAIISDIMRTVDAYAFGCRCAGRLASTRIEIEKQISAALASQPAQAPQPREHFAIVMDRMFADEGLSLAVWNGENYQFTDGDCFAREGDTLDGYTAEFLTNYQLEQRLIASQPAQAGAVGWRDHVEQRLNSWKQRFVNKSGDRLALDDFMDKQSLDDLIDYVCDEYEVFPLQAQPAPVAVDERGAFERWASDNGKWPKAVERSGEHYRLTITQSYWSAWQARADIHAALGQGVEPVAWWKRHRDGSIEINEAKTFITDDALATGRRPLVFGDTHPPAAPACHSQSAAQAPQAYLSRAAAPQQDTVPASQHKEAP